MVVSILCRHDGRVHNIRQYYMIECSSIVLLTHTVEPDASEVITEAWFYVAT